MMDGGTTEVTVKILTDKEKEDRKKNYKSEGSGK